jgi:hypothetical protein
MSLWLISVASGKGMGSPWIFFHSEVACAIWNVFLGQFGLSWVMPRQSSRFVFLLVDC